MTDFTRHINVRQEVHFNLNNAVTGTVFTASTLNVKAKAAGTVTAQFSFWSAGKQLTDRREQAGVGCRVGARRAANWRLVNNNCLVELLNALNIIMAARHGVGAHQTCLQ